MATFRLPTLPDQLEPVQVYRQLLGRRTYLEPVLQAFPQALVLKVTEEFPAAADLALFLPDQLELL